jgi:hypothetical protein
MRTVIAWLRNYAGAVLVMAVLGAAVIFFVLAFKADQANSSYSSLYYEIAGTLATTALTAMLLGLSDIVAFVSRLVAAAITNGSFLSHLSPKTRRELIQKIIEVDVADSAKTLHLPLLHQAIDLVYSYVSGPYWTNYSYKNDISVNRELHGLFDADCSVRYKVHVEHLSSLPTAYQISYIAQWDVMSLHDLSEEQVVSELNVTAGSQSWSKKDAEIQVTRESGRTTVKVKFEREVKIREDTDVTFRIKALQDFVDPVDLMYFKYPVRGFSASLNHDGGRGWQDASVFRPCKSGQISLSAGEPIIKSNSVEFSCGGEWVFPGGGFVFVFPRDPEMKHPVKSWKRRPVQSRKPSNPHVEIIGGSSADS